MVMTDDAGQMKDKAAAGQPGIATAHALIVGVANYSGINSLPEAVLNDAKDIASILKSPDYCAYDPANVRVLLDKDATLAGIRAALDEIAQASTSDDTVVVYFSGHGADLSKYGGDNAGLLPVDCDIAKLTDTALGAAEFSTKLKAITAARLVVILDACHSGGAGAVKALQRVQFGVDVKTLADLAVGRGRVFMASSRRDQVSVIAHGARNSVFTEHLLDGLRGKAAAPGEALIRVFQLFSYVSEKVRASTHGKQTPNFQAFDVEDNFALARAPFTAGSAPVHKTPAKADDIWKCLERILPELYPDGPTDERIWARAGGDQSRLPSARTGRTRWFEALKILRLGGGGKDFSVEQLTAAVLEDFPHHLELARFI